MIGKGSTHPLPELSDYPEVVELLWGASDRLVSAYGRLNDGKLTNLTAWNGQCPETGEPAMISFVGDKGNGGKPSFYFVENEGPFRVCLKEIMEVAFAKGPVIIFNGKPWHNFGAFHSAYWDEMYRIRKWGGKQKRHENVQIMVREMKVALSNLPAPPTQRSPTLSYGERRPGLPRTTTTGEE